MVLDKEEHRAVFAQLLEKAAFPGEVAEKVVEMKNAVKQATVAEMPVARDDDDQSVAKRAGIAHWP